MLLLLHLLLILGILPLFPSREIYFPMFVNFHHFARDLSYSVNLHKPFFTKQRNVPLPYLSAKLGLNKNYFLAYYMSDAIWETVAKLMNTSFSRVITFPTPHGLIHITNSHNIDFTVLYYKQIWHQYEFRPSYPANVRLATTNVSSMINISATITDWVISKKFDILPLTET